MRLLWIISIVFLLPLLVLPVFCPAFAKEIPYSTDQVERPLTLPNGVWELGVGAEYYRWNGGSSRNVSPLLSLRYGITNNLEFYLLGLRYRVFDSDSFEFAVRGGIPRLGYSSVDGTLLLAEVGAEAKQRIHRRFALLYRLEDYYQYASNREDKNEIRVSLGGLFSLTEKVAFELTGAYRRLSGFDASDARIGRASIHYNLSSRFDTLLEGEWSDFSENGDFRYASKSFRQAYGIRFHWRF